MLKKVFGIISYFPDNDSDYHIETRRERSRRFRELLFKLEELWGDIDIIVIAQNWQDFELPEIKNKIKTYHYGKLGILGARRELRKKFLESDYDYLIMFDDDAMPDSDNPQGYMLEIDKHPDGVGTIRKNQSPLQFFAISKTIYSQIDMPNINAEKGEGFEDDIFVASCFAKFPDKAFMFPEGLVKETSFKYTGKGACPSTWSRERKLDWDYMRNHTISEVNAYEHMVNPEPQEFNGNKSIDLIITYVNNSDTNWSRDYVRATKTRNPTANRFRSWGTLKYLFRAVETYMPFIRNIVLVVAYPSQVPAWVNKKNVRIVYHKDFIPQRFLPTFNSCTIESFFWNIPDLSDRVIYFNDDMFPINPLSEEDFFTGDTPHIKFIEPETYSTKTIFQSQCRSGIDLITKSLGLPEFEKGKMFRPYHISAAITQKARNAIQGFAPAIEATISRLRTVSNVNQYIYSYYQYFTGDYIDKTVSYKYFELWDKTIDDIMAEVFKQNNQMVCLNDSDRLKDYQKTRYLLNSCFEKKYPRKSRYEI